MKSAIPVLKLASDVIEEAGPQFHVRIASEELRKRLTWSILSDSLSLAYIASVLIRNAVRTMKNGPLRRFESTLRTGDDGEMESVYTSTEEQFELFTGEERLMIFRATRSQAEQFVSKCNRYRAIIAERDGITLPELRLVEVPADAE